MPNCGAPVDGIVKMRRRKDKSYIEIRNLAIFGGRIKKILQYRIESNNNPFVTD